jgi:hypothetical protein
MSRPEAARPVVESALGSACHPYHFYCPNLAAVDQYLSTLGKYVRPGARLVPARAAAVRRDIDRLLDRRLALMTRAPTPESAKCEYRK